LKSLIGLNTLLTSCFRSVDEPVIRQVLVAFSSLHLDYISSDTLGRESARTETLQQYGKGLRMLRRRLDKPTPETTRLALICSVLFYCFEAAMGNMGGAMQHLERGLSLLASLPIDTPGSVEAVYDVLARLDVQASVFDDSRVPRLRILNANELEAGFVGSSDIPFESIEDAQRKFNKLEHWLVRLLITQASLKGRARQEYPLAALEEKAALQREFARFLEKSKHPIVPSHGASAEEMDNGLHSIMAQHLISSMVLDANIPEDPSVFEAVPNARAMEGLDHAESFVAFLQRRNASVQTAKNPRRNFSSETGIIIPVILTRIKCADAAVTQRADRLLRSAQRQEGLFDTRAMVAIVNRLEDYKSEKLKAFNPEAIPTFLEPIDEAISLEKSGADVIKGVVSSGMEDAPYLIPVTIFAGHGGAAQAKLVPDPEQLASLSPDEPSE
jgi:hypothetical protein